MAKKAKASVALKTTHKVEASFAEIVNLIESARRRAYQAVNSELVTLYWQIGKYISRKISSAEWGDAVVDTLAIHLSRTLPGLRGFTHRNHFRMRQFYETYAEDTKVSALLTQRLSRHAIVSFRSIDDRFSNCVTTGDTIQNAIWVDFTGNSQSFKYCVG